MDSDEDTSIRVKKMPTKGGTGDDMGTTEVGTFLANGRRSEPQNGNLGSATTPVVSDTSSLKPGPSRDELDKSNKKHCAQKQKIASAKEDGKKSTKRQRSTSSPEKESDGKKNKVEAENGTGRSGSSSSMDTLNAESDNSDSDEDDDEDAPSFQCGQVHN